MYISLFLSLSLSLSLSIYTEFYQFNLSPVEFSRYFAYFHRITPRGEKLSGELAVLIRLCPLFVLSIVMLVRCVWVWEDARHLEKYGNVLIVLHWSLYLWYFVALLRCT